MSDDISLIIRRCKRAGETKLNLSGKNIQILPSEIFAYANLEILDLSNNNILSLDDKIGSMKQLKYLDLSNNSIMQLPTALLGMPNLNVLAMTNNPLSVQFSPLLNKENQSTPRLQEVLKSCFSGAPLDNMNSSQSSILSKESISPTEIKTPVDKKAAWFDTIPSKMVASVKTPEERLTEMDKLLKLEQQKNIELTRKVEEISKKGGSDGNNLKSVFENSQQLIKYLEIPFDELKIGSKISQGGFSIVDEGIFRGTKVAVKKIFNPVITQELLSELNNEIMMLSLLRHPNIVMIMGVCSKPPNLCIVTEYLPNGSLFEMLHKSKTEMKPSMKMQMIKEIATCINFLHETKIVHRDIKSHNVLFGDNNRVKVCDFGLARFTYDINQSSMVFAGTPTYMAPELFMKKAYDEKIDVFSFGTMTWEILERAVPHDGIDPNDIKDKVCTGEKLEFSKQNIPKKLMNMVHACRVPDPRKRPTMKEVLDTLDEITAEAGTR